MRDSIRLLEPFDQLTLVRAAAAVAILLLGLGLIFNAVALVVDPSSGQAAASRAVPADPPSPSSVVGSAVLGMVLVVVSLVVAMRRSRIRTPSK